MTETKNPWIDALADLEARRDKLDQVIELAKTLRDTWGTDTVPTTASLISASGAAGPVSASPRLDGIPTDAFFNLTLVDAALKFLSTWANRRPQSTKTIIEAFERGGLAGKAYATVYGVLNRRQNKMGDIVNVNGDWGLAEWYGAKPKRRLVSLDPATFEKEPEEEPAQPAPAEAEKAPA